MAGEPRFEIGAWSMLLLVLGVQVLLLALVLAFARRRPPGSRWLALALLVIAGLLTPFIIGYAGAYDAWPWLSFAPFAVPLALGPAIVNALLCRIGRRPLPALHWLAPALQLLAQALAFPLSLEAKARVHAALFEPLLNPLFSAAALASMLAYGLIALGLLRDYAGWLRARRRSTGPARRMLVPVLALGVLVAVRSAYDLFELAVREVDYFDLFGYYVLLGVLGLWLGVDAMRGLDQPVPEIDEDENSRWQAMGRDWIARIEREGWWRDSQVASAGLARRLATNQAYLARALKAAEGSVPTVIARIRAEDAARRIESGNDSLLDIALASGFGSKAAFNRAFAARFGRTPSQYRAEQRRKS